MLIRLSKHIHDITNDAQKLAHYYREALQDEFPQYEYSLSGLFEEDGALLRVVRRNTTPGRSLLVAKFESSHIAIEYVKLDGTIHRVEFDYANPEFTEDILSKILRAYHAD